MDINKQPKLEDLLKVKKAEQPNDAFWEKFDRELEKKTLQTFLRQDPWYRNWANWFIRHTSSASMAYGLICLMGIALYLNNGFEGNNLGSNINSNDQIFTTFEEMAGSVELLDYEIVTNDAFEKDYSGDIIVINGVSETYDFKADTITVAIGNTADYSDSSFYASSDSLYKSNPYTQMASFAF